SLLAIGQDQYIDALHSFRMTEEPPWDMAEIGPGALAVIQVIPESGRSEMMGNMPFPDPAIHRHTPVWSENNELLVAGYRLTVRQWWPSPVCLE
ncbi:MAG: hypothetical protein JW910_10335, partial [Anaerolineae bacterium]|nr:hypothetical protein [Anaerolineae bacterium]